MTKKDSCPPRGAGHYSGDRTKWWDDERGTWLDLSADDQDTLEIELENYGGTSFRASLFTTLGSQSGSTLYRFVGTAHSSDPRWPTYRIAGGTFPAPRVIADAIPQPEWAPGMNAQLAELRHRLTEEGWLPAGHGAHPWSFTYTRPCLRSPGEDANHVLQPA